MHNDNYIVVCCNCKYQPNGREQGLGPRHIHLKKKEDNGGGLNSAGLNCQSRYGRDPHAVPRHLLPLHPLNLSIENLNRLKALQLLSIPQRRCFQSKRFNDDHPHQIYRKIHVPRGRPLGTLPLGTLPSGALPRGVFN